MRLANFMVGAALITFTACSNPDNTPLPIVGNTVIVNGDTIYHQIADFRFINQDSQWVDNATFAGKVYVADFFFTSCPTICPKVTRQMLRLYEHYAPDNRILFLSHSIDVRRDTVERLKEYATGLGVTSDRWHFVTGDHDQIYEMADDYFSTALVDTDAPGGFDHSGLLILVDENRHVRSFCDGTNEEEVNRLMMDIDKLLRQEYSSRLD
ncbi:MAG: SCO family protein [Saprospiraceae bacterium]